MKRRKNNNTALLAIASVSLVVFSVAIYGMTRDMKKDQDKGSNRKLMETVEVPGSSVAPSVDEEPVKSKPEKKRVVKQEVVLQTLSPDYMRNLGLKGNYSGM